MRAAEQVRGIEGEPPPRRGHGRAAEVLHREERGAADLDEVEGRVAHVCVAVPQKLDERRDQQRAPRFPRERPARVWQADVGAGPREVQQRRRYELPARAVPREDDLARAYPQAVHEPAIRRADLDDLARELEVGRQLVVQLEYRELDPAGEEALFHEVQPEELARPARVDYEAAAVHEEDDEIVVFALRGNMGVVRDPPASYAVRRLGDVGAPGLVLSPGGERVHHAVRRLAPKERRAALGWGAPAEVVAREADDDVGDGATAEFAVGVRLVDVEGYEGENVLEEYG